LAVYDTIWFLSDYGLDDEFVGVVKAVIRAFAPSVDVVDVTHGVPSHDVRAGALTLARTIQYLGPGVVLAVVDPGVGSGRRAVAIEAGESEDASGPDGATPARFVLVGPDNGLLAPAVAMAGGARRAVSLTDPRFHLDAPGPTFAGRDVFAPVAASLCGGVDLAELGEAIDPSSLLPGVQPLPQVQDGKLTGEVLWVDRFGNAQLNLGPEELEALGDPITVSFGDRARVATRVACYADLAPGQLGLLVDSYGLMALVVSRRSAAQELGLAAGDAVTLSPAG
jgi:S-adenosylmethionine hydrolase